MNMFIIDNEVFIRLGFFFGIFFSMAIWEMIAPRRSLSQPKRIRWFNNIGITVFNSVLVRLVFPAAAVGAAVLSEQQRWGLFNILIVPKLIAGVVAVIILDLTIYTQHVIFHKVPLLWRLHRMHHTDLDVDVTTGARFHPVEILLSMGIKIGMVFIIGVYAWSVVVFEVLLNGTSMFNHSNVFMNEKIDRFLRMVVVTPDMHRVHHSVIIKETDSNFGFNLSWWDRLFGTYRAQPASGHEAMVLGLSNYRNPKWLTLRWMMAIPFAKRLR